MSSSTGSDDASQSSNSSSQALYRLYTTGLDSVEFLLSAGPNEPLRPLAAVASGGEAARIMLALKAAPAAAAAAARVQQAPVAASGDGSADGLQQQQQLEQLDSQSAFSLGPPVVIMDETDAGVGSRLGETVGRLLKGMVTGDSPAAQQLIVVSHTPQVR